MLAARGEKGRIIRCFSFFFYLHYIQIAKSAQFLDKFCNKEEEHKVIYIINNLLIENLIHNASKVLNL